MTIVTLTTIGMLACWIGANALRDLRRRAYHQWTGQPCA